MRPPMSGHARRNFSGQRGRVETNPCRPLDQTSDGHWHLTSRSSRSLRSRQARKGRAKQGLRDVERRLPDAGPQSAQGLHQRMIHALEIPRFCDSRNPHCVTCCRSENTIVNENMAKKRRQARYSAAINRAPGAQEAPSRVRNSTLIPGHLSICEVSCSPSHRNPGRSPTVP
jgi:hypothetical protein